MESRDMHRRRIESGREQGSSIHTLPEIFVSCVAYCKIPRLRALQPNYLNDHRARLSTTIEESALRGIVTFKNQFVNNAIDGYLVDVWVYASSWLSSCIEYNSQTPKESAYRWLSRQYETGDRIYLFGDYFNVETAL